VWLEQARSYLRGADPVLAQLIDARPDFNPRAWLARLPPMDLFGALLFQVIGQQLSVAATRRTLARIGALFDGHLPAPAGLLAVDPAKLREAGLSWRKIGMLRGVAERLSDGRLDQAALIWDLRRPCDYGGLGLADGIKGLNRTLVYEGADSAQPAMTGCWRAQSQMLSLISGSLAQRAAQSAASGRGQYGWTSRSNLAWRCAVVHARPGPPRASSTVTLAGSEPNSSTRAPHWAG